MVGLFLALSEYLGLFNPVRSRAELIFKTPLSWGYQVSELIVSPGKMVWFSLSAKERIKELEIALATTKAYETEMDMLKEENEELRSLLENTDRNLRESVISTVILSSSVPMVGAGSKEGVEVGDGVLVANTLVGRVSRVHDHLAEVDLLLSPQSQPVLVVSQSGVKGVVAGDGKKVILSEIDREAPIEPQERLKTQGQTGLKPGLFVGLRGNELTKPQDETRVFVIDSIVDFYQSGLVEIVTD